MPPLSSLSVSRASTLYLNVGTPVYLYFATDHHVDYYILSFPFRLKSQDPFEYFPYTNLVNFFIHRDFALDMLTINIYCMCPQFRPSDETVWIDLLFPPKSYLENPPTTLPTTLPTLCLPLYLHRILPAFPRAGRARPRRPKSRHFFDSLNNIKFPARRPQIKTPSYYCTQSRYGMYMCMFLLK